MNDAEKKFADSCANLFMVGGALFTIGTTVAFGFGGFCIGLGVIGMLGAATDLVAISIKKLATGGVH